MNFLSLVNDVNGALNEVPLTSINFSTASGYYTDAKRAVNAAIRQINQIGVEWPFNKVLYEQPLIINQVRYSPPADSRSLKMNSFRIKGSTVDNITTGWLAPLDYDSYIARYSDMEYQPDKYKGFPQNVFLSPSLQFGILPPPDKTYTLAYEYVRIPVDLELWDDVPTIPVIMKHVINDGSLYYAYMFRGDKEAAMLQRQLFLDGIRDMRNIFIPIDGYIRTTQRGRSY